MWNWLCKISKNDKLEYNLNIKLNNLENEIKNKISENENFNSINKNNKIEINKYCKKMKVEP